MQGCWPASIVRRQTQRGFIHAARGPRTLSARRCNVTAIHRRNHLASPAFPCHLNASLFLLRRQHTVHVTASPPYFPAADLAPSTPRPRLQLGTCAVLSVSDKASQLPHTHTFLLSYIVIRSRVRDAELLLAGKLAGWLDLTQGWPSELCCMVAGRRAHTDRREQNANK